MWNKIYKAIVKSQQRRAAYWQMQNLTDKELRDIGISRAEIKRIAYEVQYCTAWLTNKLYHTCQKSKPLKETLN